MSKLTAKAVDALVRKAGRGEPVKEYTPDGGALYLRILKSGHASFWLRQSGYAPLKVCDAAIGLAEARRLSLMARAARAGGVDPAAERKAAREAVKAKKVATKVATKNAAAAPDTFAAIYAGYLQRHLRPKLRSAHAIDLAFRADVLPVWGDLPIRSITRAMVSTLVYDIADRQAPRSKGQGSPRAAELRLRYISGLFKWAEGMGYVEANPAERVPKPKEKEARERVLSDAELRLIWQACDRMDPVNAPFVRLLMISGQRKSEIGGGFWSEIDLDAKTWSMPKERVKNGTAHTFHLPAGAAAILQGIARNGDKIFTGPLGGKTWGSAKAKSTLDSIITELNGGEPLEHWTLHDLRRTAATRMGDLGIAPHAIECVLGHVGGFRGGVSGVYNKSNYWAEMVDALNRWDARLKVIISDADNVVALPVKGRA